MPHGFDLEKIARAVRLMLEGMGEDVEREGLLETPSRVARMYEELCYGIGRDAGHEITCLFEESQSGCVVIRDIQFASICEHHLVPFFGVAHVGYLPDAGRITGLSKLARVVELVARRPQVQERMTNEIADALAARLKPQGVAVILEAEHVCMSIRGIKKPGSRTITSAFRGEYQINQSARAEIMSLMNRA